MPVTSVLNWGTPFKTFKYFGVKSVSQSHADWHVLDTVGPHDTGKAGGGSAAAPTAPAGQGEVGYVIMDYQHQQLQ